MIATILRVCGGLPQGAEGGIGCAMPGFQPPEREAGRGHRRRPGRPARRRHLRGGQHRHPPARRVRDSGSVACLVQRERFRRAPARSPASAFSPGGAFVFTFKLGSADQPARLLMPVPSRFCARESLRKRSRGDADGTDEPRRSFGKSSAALCFPPRLRVRSFGCSAHPIPETGMSWMELLGSSRMPAREHFSSVLHRHDQKGVRSKRVDEPVVTINDHLTINRVLPLRHNPAVQRKQGSVSACFLNARTTVTE